MKKPCEYCRKEVDSKSMARHVRKSHPPLRLNTSKLSLVGPPAELHLKSAEWRRSITQVSKKGHFQIAGMTPTELLRHHAAQAGIR